MRDSALEKIMEIAEKGTKIRAIITPMKFPASLAVGMAAPIATSVVVNRANPPIRSRAPMIMGTGLETRAARFRSGILTWSRKKT